MVFFNFSSLLKSIVYGIKGIVKYICCSLLIVSFVVVCLLLLGRESNAISDVVYDSILDYYHNSNYTDIIAFDGGGFILFNNTEGNKFYMNQSWLRCLNEDNIPTGAYSTSSTGVITNTQNNLRFGVGNNRYNIGSLLPIVYSTVDIYTNSSFTDLFYSKNFVAPSFLNHDNSNWSGTLENGEFNYFYIDGNSANKIYLYLYDKTYGVGDSDWLSWSTVLDSSSSYIYDTTEGSYKWAFLKTVPFGSYQNSHDYSLVLQYQDNNEIWHDLTYNWTTDFSQSVIDDEQSKISGGINNIDNYLNNDEVNDSDFELPEINVNDFTFSFFSTLVGSITDAFLDTTNDEVITFDVRGNTYTIHSTEFNVLGNAGLVVIKNFVALFWVFSIGYWIFCDARKRIMRLKEFNWTAMFADDISVDML